MWVDLARLYPRSADIRPLPEGWDVQAVVPGEQTAWLKTTTGAWIAEVRYSVRRGDGSEGVQHTGWLPAEAVRLRHDTPARREPDG